VVSVQELNPEVSDDLARIISRMMAKYPRDRFPTATAVRGALAGLAKPTMSQELPSISEGRKILIADDDAVTRRTIQRQLEKAGYEVVVAEDGRQAIDRFTPDLAACLFDLNMPKATGLECLRIAQARCPDIPVLLISSATEVGDAVAAMRDGAFDYLVKPCRVKHILSRVEEAIQARRKKVEEATALSKLRE
jgi:DNA-binding NtrC family response regulator